MADVSQASVTSAVARAALPSTGSTRESTRGLASEHVRRSGGRRTKGWWRRPLLVTGATAATTRDGGARRSTTARAIDDEIDERKGPFGRGAHHELGGQGLGVEGGMAATKS